MVINFATFCNNEICMKSEVFCTKIKNQMILTICTSCLACLVIVIYVKYTYSKNIITNLNTISEKSSS